MRFRLDRFGLLVILFYNLVFLMECGLSIVVLANNGTAPFGLSLTVQILKNLDMVFKAYFTFEMYRVRIWLTCDTPEQLERETKKMRVLSWVLLPIIIVNQVCGLVLGIAVDSPVIKVTCQTIFIVALCPMLYIFCKQVMYFTKRWLLQKQGVRLSLGQNLAVTWLNVWLILMYLRLLLSTGLLIFGYLRLGDPSIVENQSFLKAEGLLTVLFLYLDQPLIVGCSLTILTVYYKVGKRKYVDIREDTETREVKGLMLS